MRERERSFFRGIVARRVSLEVRRHKSENTSGPEPPDSSNSEIEALSRDAKSRESPESQRLKPPAHS